MFLDLLGLPATGLENPDTNLEDPALYRALLAGDLHHPAGVEVTEQGALNVLVASLCIRILAETSAILPVEVHEVLSERETRKVPDHRVRRLLHGKPNPEMNALTFRETLFGHVNSWGNGYAEKEFNHAGDLIGLWPLPPHRTRIERLRDNRGRVRKTVVVNVNGRLKALDPRQVFHLPWFGFDGLRGYSPVRLAASALGLAQAMEIFAQRFFGAGAYISGFVTSPKFIKPERRHELRAELETMHSGLSRSHRIGLLDEGMDWKTVNMPLEEAQLLQSRLFQTGQIAAFFRLTPDRVGIFEKAATYASLDATETRHVKEAIWPLIERFEAAADDQLLDRWSSLRSVPGQVLDERRGPEYCLKHNLSAILRGEPHLRAQVQSIYRLAGILNADEIRAQEDLNPQANGQGQIYWRPANMLPADAPVSGGRRGVGSGGGGGATELPAVLEAAFPEWARPPVAEPAIDGRADRALRRLLLAACERLATFEGRALERVLRKSPAAPQAAAAAWYREALQTETVARELRPPLLAWAELLGFTDADELVAAYAAERAEQYRQARARTLVTNPDAGTPHAVAERETKAARQLLLARLEAQGACDV